MLLDVFVSLLAVFFTLLWCFSPRREVRLPSRLSHVMQRVASADVLVDSPVLAPKRLDLDVENDDDDCNEALDALATLERLPNGQPRCRIAMCSDFSYPNMGGVEMHIYQLSQCLIQMGHHVIVIAHSYGDRKGVRIMSNGLKTYYLCHRALYNGASASTFGINLLPVIRQIFIREKIDIVHAHQAFSNIGHESLLFARTMGLRTCFTDHSLFGFADASSILMNKVLKFSLSDIDHVICVSHTSRENTCIRAAIEPDLVSVIPNAIDATTFTPDPSKQDPSRITIVVISRLAYRKGIDLLVDVIPRVCEQHPSVHWIIGGDGPKRLELDEMRERHQLHDRVELLGAVPHKDVRDVLVRGNIFVNTSLTEAFCIAIVEAVSAGLSAVSTNVGGVPEVFPGDMIRLARPDAGDIVARINDAIAALPSAEPHKQHARVRRMYSWRAVAERTVIVYTRIMQQPRVSLLERLRRVYGCGRFAGILNCYTVGMNAIWYEVLEWWQPRNSIDVCPRVAPFAFIPSSDSN